MSKLMEVRFHFVVLQQGWSVSGGLAEISHHCSYSHLPGPIREQTAGLQAKACSMAVLALPTQIMEN